MTMSTAYNNIKESFQIHNYSFKAIQAFVLEVKKYPLIYKDNQHTNNNDSDWSKIVRTLLENGLEYILTPSQRSYWERIYRGLWMWMRHILTSDVVGRYLGYIGLSKNPKYIWLEYLKFLEPFIQLSANSFHYDTDLDPFIYLQVLSSDEVTQVPYCHYMVYWKQFHETLVSETFYISICVQTMEYAHFDYLNLELDLFLEKIIDNNEDFADIEIPEEEIIPLSPSSTSNDISEEVTNIIEEQLISSLIEDADYDGILGGFVTNVDELEA